VTAVRLIACPDCGPLRPVIILKRFQLDDPECGAREEMREMESGGYDCGMRMSAIPATCRRDQDSPAPS
jgi:hypothetical protein